MASGMVVDIPLHPLELPDDRRCIHVLRNGERCAFPQSMEERCDIHYEWFISPLATMGVQFPEDAISLQMMLGKALEMVVMNRVDYKKAKAVVEICKLMAHNVRAFQFEVQDAGAAMRKQRSKVICG